MSVQELCPRVGCPVWTRLDLCFLEDIPNGLLADVFDPEFPKFPDDSRVAESGCLGDFNHKFPQFTWLPLTDFGILGLGLTSLLVPQPPKECCWRDNRDQ
ncbi:MAG TPA: hypothetical protein DIW81_20985, partial [Planctomycetaceae bacterium]|nr:hypothetical protein [Planctomycetaceae bacterium]